MMSGAVGGIRGAIELPFFELARLQGRGRDEDCSSPPAQIRTCGFPASGSCLRSNVIGLRGVDALARQPPTSIRACPRLGGKAALEAAQALGRIKGFCPVL